MGNASPRCTAEFRQRAVDLHRQSGTTYAEVARMRPSTGSMSSPWDNAAMESPMGPVKAECVHAETYDTRDRAMMDMFGYVEVVYNGRRIHSAPGCMSPVEFEKANWPEEDGRTEAA